MKPTYYLLFLKGSKATKHTDSHANLTYIVRNRNFSNWHGEQGLGYIKALYSADTSGT